MPYSDILESMKYLILALTLVGLAACGKAPHSVFKDFDSQSSNKSFSMAGCGGFGVPCEGVLNLAGTPCACQLEVTGTEDGFNTRFSHCTSPINANQAYCSGLGDVLLGAVNRHDNTFSVCIVGYDCEIFE